MTRLITPMSSSRRSCRDSRVGENMSEVRQQVAPADAGDVDPWVLQGVQQGAVAWFEEVDPLDGLAVHLARPGQAVERANPGGEVVQRGEVSEIAPVAAEQDLAQVDQAVDGLLDRCEFPGRRARCGVPPFGGA